ncbi:hypothetical protein CLOSTHATH_02916 [Hungatella hathewayi DSM 13479]|uniref:Uncharacterized protein n=1 Tax=Hungatella hathewayi DSM 13479 TaxID=566550 RepID=D3AH29_9FIRM|nr:hypothetical protein CLOSTHATH_02916 [Hungatella hathewayi DSM 13479]
MLYETGKKRNSVLLFCMIMKTPENGQDGNKEKMLRKEYRIYETVRAFDSL